MTIKPTAFEKAALKKLGVTYAGFRCLLLANGKPDGIAQGRGFGNGLEGAREKLRQQGYLEDRPHSDSNARHLMTITIISPAGREIVRQARALGL